MAENELNILWRLAWSKFVHLSSESTAHGYHNIFKTKYNFIRVMWIIAFTGAVGFCSYLVIAAISDYFQYDVTTKIRLEYNYPLNFPTVHMCNTKPLLTQSAYDYSVHETWKLMGDPKNLTDLEIELLYGNFTKMNISILQRPIADYASIIQNQVADPAFNKTLRESFGLNQHQFIIISRFGDMISNDSAYYTEYYQPVYGNCFKFNSGDKMAPIIKQNESGEAYGFSAVFFVDTYPNQSYNFIDVRGPLTYGVRISIEEQNSIDAFTSNVIHVEPGTCNFIGIRKFLSKNLPQPYSSCQDLTNYHSVLYDRFIALNKTYSQKSCYQMCKQKKIFDACNCAVKDFPNVNHYQTCQKIDQIKCVEGLSVNTSGCEQYCPMACEYTYYEFTTTTELFPDMIVYKIFKNLPQVELAFARANLTIDSVSYEAFSKSMACVYVYYNDMRVTTIEENASMTQSDLFSSIGGSLGLCMGMSILSFYELFEVFIEILCIYADKRKVKDEKQKFFE